MGRLNKSVFQNFITEKKKKLTPKVVNIDFGNQPDRKQQFFKSKILKLRGLYFCEIITLTRLGLVVKQ